jgi:hypothetical protein
MSTENNQTGIVIDPTANVLKLVEEAAKRLDDLRDAEAKRVDGLLIITREYEEKLRAKEGELRLAESKRLDAIREVDNINMTRNSESANAQALALAKQVTDTASIMAKQWETLTTQQSDRVSKIEAAMSEIKGKTGVTDPLMEALSKKMDLVIESRSVGEGKTKGFSTMWAYIVGAIGLTATIILLGEKLFGG